MLRFDPFRELDRLTGNAFDGSSQGTIPMDVVRSASDVTLYFDVPGIDPSSIELTVERNKLTLRATRRYELDEGQTLVVRERPSGDFARTLVLSESLDAGRISADYQNGVLVVRVPVAEMAQARKVSISGASDTPVIETTGGDPAAANDQVTSWAGQQS